MSQQSKLTPDQWAQVRRWEDQGVSRPQIARMIETQYGVNYTRSGLGKALGKRGLGEPQPPGSVVFKVYLTPDEMERVRDVAAGCGRRIARGPGNPSGLLRGIASGELRVTEAQ